LYVGLLGVVIGGLGIAYEAAVPRQTASDVPAATTADITSAAAVSAMPTTASAPQGSAWPLEPRHAAVPFNEQMLELLSPPTPPPEQKPAVQKAGAPAPEPDATVGVATREADQPPPLARKNPARDRREKQERRKAKHAPPPAAEADETVGVATRGEPARENERERVQDNRKNKNASRTRGRQVEGKDATVEVEVRDQFGRRILTERMPRERAERTAREEQPRRYDGGERRGFNLFGIFGGDRW
jgi:hypothetical protein